MSLNNEMAPSNGEAPNISTIVPNKAVAERYREAYDTIFEKLTKENQAIILDAVKNPTVTSRVLDLFINDVITLAEKQD